MSTRTLLVLLAGVAAIANGANTDGRIVGGDMAVENEFPWQVSLRRLLGRHFCGGALISTTKVLTAAHCVDSYTAADVSVITGSTSLARGGEFHEVSSIAYHDNYLGGQETSWRYDIAIITLATPAGISANQHPIPLSSSYLVGNEPAITSGWGRAVYPGYALPTALQKFNLIIWSNADCSDIHTLTIYDDHICAMSEYGQGVCSGDSGGPLVVNGEVVGVTSWARLCGVGYPDVYTRVYSYLDWIAEQMAESSA